MAKTVITDGIDPEILTEAVQGAFSGKNAFMDSFLVATGAAVVDGSFPESAPNRIGSTVEVPYFGTLPPFVPNPDGSAVTPQKIAQISETAITSRDSLAFEVSRWAENGWKGDPYAECARQILLQATRAMDSRLITGACAAGTLMKSVYVPTGAAAANMLSWDLVINARTLWADELGADVVGMIMSSAAYADVLKLKDSQGRPLMVDSFAEGDFPRFAGLPVHVSDRLDMAGSTMGAVVSAGTTPPAVTLSGTPSGPWNLKIDIVAGGALATATFRFSTDGGQTWSKEMPTAASVPLIDTAVDSIVGNNGATGITALFASGTYATNNEYTSSANIKSRTLMLRRQALAFWYNQQALSLLTDSDILADTRLGAMHLYAAAHRYRRSPNSTKPGVIIIEHNVSQFTGA